ncbi:MAG TPA: DUF4157 domain-containing protein [Fluviicola sp.]|nr:DUF4157 domain-containing protein [Fluviicola sp.]
MIVYAEKASEQPKTIADNTSRASLVNDRPEARNMKNLQHSAIGSAQVKQLQAYQTMADQSVVQRQANTTGMPDNLKSGIESLSGYSMSDVKVHYNSDKPAQLNAYAYAQGTDIHLASGQEKHLPHEAWHVVQQKQGRVKPTMQLKGKIAINDDAGLEHEADMMGAKAMQMKPIEQGILTEAQTGQSANIPVQRVIIGDQKKMGQAGQLYQRFFKEYYENPYKTYNLDGDRLNSFVAFVDCVKEYWDMNLISSDLVYEKYLEHLGNNVQTMSEFEESFADAGYDDHGYDVTNDPGEFDGSSSEEVIQQARKPGLSGPKSYGKFKNMLFMKTTPDATIDFDAGLGKSSSPQNNMPGSFVDMSTVIKGGKVVSTIYDPHKKKTVKMNRAGATFDKADRDQHFAISDMLFYINTGKKPNRAGTWTWHHLTPKYHMVLVNMLVHAKHGHNGGVHIW